MCKTTSKITSTFLVTLALWAMAGASDASARAGSDWRECNGRDADARIAACSRILDQGARGNSTMRAGAFNSRASAWFSKGEYERAARDLDEAIAEKPNNPVLYYNRGLVLANKGDNEAALRSFDEAISLNPRYSSAYNDRANVFFRQKDYDRAISGYDEAIRLDPRNSTLWGNRGNTYRQKGDYD